MRPLPARCAKKRIVRDAIAEFSRANRASSDRERLGMLRTFDDELVPKIEDRNAAEVDAELAELRSARHDGGRQTIID